MPMADEIPDQLVHRGTGGSGTVAAAGRGSSAGKVARLECTRFEPGYPDSHAMVAQVGKIGLQQGQWYRLRLWAKAARLETGTVHIAIVNRRTWQETGFQESFAPRGEWEPFEFTFQARVNLAPEDSRLQIWTTGRGLFTLMM